MKKLHTLILGTALLTHCAAHAMAASEDNSIGFAEAWLKIAADNDTLAAARENLIQAEQKRDAAKDMYFPEIELSANYIYLDKEVTLSPHDILESMPAGDRLTPLINGLGQSYGLTAAAMNSTFTSTIAERQNRSSAIHGYYPIYAGGRIEAAQDIAAGQEGEATEKLAMTRQEQFETLAKYYFGVVLAKQVYETRQEVEVGLRKHRDHAVLLEEQGQIARVERLQAEAAYDKARVERRKAASELDIAGVALTRMLKSSESVVTRDNLFLNDTLPPLSSFIAKTLAHSPGLGILKAKQEQAAGLIAVEEGKYLPTVAVFGNYNIYEEDDLANKLLPDWVVGVGIKVPLFERSGRAGNLGAAKSMARQLTSLQLQAKSDLSVLAEKTYRQAEQAVEEYTGLGSSLELAEETVNLRIKAFAQGLSTSLDVVDAELFLAGVKTQRAAAGYNYVLALAKLLAVSGEAEDLFLYQNTQAIEVR